MPPPSHQTFAGPNFVICSFCPRKLDFDPDAIPIPYHHSNLQSEEMIYYVDGNFSSRKGIEVGSVTLHPTGPAARAAAGARREVARHDGDARVRRHVRHVQPAAADDARRRHSTTASTCSRGRRTRRRTAARPTTTPPASPRIYRCSSSSTGTAPARCRTPSWPRSTTLGDPSIYEREYASYGEALAAEVGTLALHRGRGSALGGRERRAARRASTSSSSEYRPLIVSSGLPQLIMPVLEREGIELEVRSNFAEPVAGRLARALPPRRAVPGVRRPLQAALAAGRAAARLRRRRLVRPLRVARRRPRLRAHRPGGYLDEQRVPYERYDTFHDVAAALS